MPQPADHIADTLDAIHQAITEAASGEGIATHRSQEHYRPRDGGDIYRIVIHSPTPDEAPAGGHLDIGQLLRSLAWLGQVNAGWVLPDGPDAASPPKLILQVQDGPTCWEVAVELPVSVPEELTDPTAELPRHEPPQAPRREWPTAGTPAQATRTTL